MVLQDLSVTPAGRSSSPRVRYRNETPAALRAGEEAVMTDIPALMEISRS